MSANYNINSQHFQPSTPANIIETILANVKTIAGGSAPELLKELATMFLEDTPPLLTELTIAIEAHDAVRVRKAAHTLKGSSGSMGIDRLSQLCYEIERMARNNTLDKLNERALHLLAEYQQVEKALEEVLAVG